MKKPRSRLAYRSDDTSLIMAFSRPRSQASFKLIVPDTLIMHSFASNHIISITAFTQYVHDRIGLAVDINTFEALTSPMTNVGAFES